MIMSNILSASERRHTSQQPSAPARNLRTRLTRSLPAPAPSLVLDGSLHVLCRELSQKQQQPAVCEQHDERIRRLAAVPILPMRHWSLLPFVSSSPFSSTADLVVLICSSSDFTLPACSPPSPPRYRHRRRQPQVISSQDWTAPHSGSQGALPTRQDTRKRRVLHPPAGLLFSRVWSSSVHSEACLVASR